MVKPTRASFHFPTVANLKAASLLLLDNDFAVLRAQFDRSNLSVGAVNLLGDQGRAFAASVCFTFRDVAASVDAKKSRRGIEIEL